MSIQELIGKWKLIASAAEKAENSFTDNRPSKTGLKNWLESVNHKLISSASENQGLVVEIDSDGNFNEQKTGEPKIDWYDNEGILVGTVTPFDGKLVEFSSKFYLIPNEVPSFAQPKDGLFEAKLRYDDGDTKICEQIEFFDDKLIRTINISTDECRFDRIVLVYAKVQP